MKLIAVLSIGILIVWPWSSFLSSESAIEYSFDEDEIRDYIPICTNNITCDELYGRIVTTPEETCYEFMFYWKTQEGVYKFSAHDHDWEFVVVYVNPNGTVNQVNYDSWHYYIGRTKNPIAFDDTNVLLYVNEDFHYFMPDRQIREGNISWQVNNQTLNELTDDIIQLAETQVGFDSKLFINPFDWKDMGWFGRYTAFNSAWKAFWVVADKKFEFVDLSDNERLVTKWL